MSRKQLFPTNVSSATSRLLAMLDKRFQAVARQLKSHSWASSCLLALSGIAAIVPTFGLGVLCIVFATHVINLSTSLFKRFVISILAILAVNALLYEIFSVINLTPPIEAVGFGYGLTAFLIVCFTVRKDYLRVIDRSDIASLVGGVVIICALIYPVTINLHGSRHHTEAVLHLLSAGEDNASHYALFKYSFMHEKYAYGSSPGTSGLIGTLVNYPQSSEFSMGWLAKGLFAHTHIRGDSALIQFYFLLTVCNFGICIFMILLLAFTLYHKARKRVTLGRLVAIAITAGSFFFVSPLLEIFARGFVSQIFAYNYLLALLLVFCLAGKRQPQRVAIVLAALLMAGICTSWWYLAPVAASSMILYLYETSQLRKKIFSHKIALVVVLFGLYPVILSLFSSIQTDALNAKGGVDVISTTALVLMLAITTATLLLKPAGSHLKYVWVSIAALIMFTLLVAIYQVVETGHFQYYYYKSLFTLVPLSGVLLVYLTLRLTQAVLKASGRIKGILATVLIPGIFFAVLIVLNPVNPRVYVHDWYNNPTSFTNYGTLLRLSAQKRYTQILYVGGCTTGEAYLYDRWSGALNLTDNPIKSRFDTATLQGNRIVALDQLKKLHHQDQRIYIVAIPACLDKSSQLTIYVTRTGITSNL